MGSLNFREFLRKVVNFGNVAGNLSFKLSHLLFFDHCIILHFRDVLVSTSELGLELFNSGD